MKKFADETRRSMIKVKGGYSDTTGLSPFRTQLQLEEFDERARMILSNTTFDMLEFYLEKGGFSYRHARYSLGDHEFCKQLLSNVFAEKIGLPANRKYDWRAVFEHNIHPVILKAPYNEVLDIIWYISNWMFQNMEGWEYIHIRIFNEVFERECIGYRFVDGKIVAITDAQEICEIEEAARCKFDGCRVHISKAIEFLADREFKDYKNCIKESISAVESICKVITKNEHATLGDALKVLEKKRGLQGPLKAAFEKLYAYTNDKGGVRHADGLFASDATFEEAKFMLVSCSAFVNYLIAEYGKFDGESK